MGMVSHAVVSHAVVSHAVVSHAVVSHAVVSHVVISITELPRKTSAYCHELISVIIASCLSSMLKFRPVISDSDSDCVILSAAGSISLHQSSSAHLSLVDGWRAIFI